MGWWSSILTLVTGGVFGVWVGTDSHGWQQPSGRALGRGWHGQSWLSALSWRATAVGPIPTVSRNFCSPSKHLGDHTVW